MLRTSDPHQEPGFFESFTIPCLQSQANLGTRALIICSGRQCALIVAQYPHRGSTRQNRSENSIWTKETLWALPLWLLVMPAAAKEISETCNAKGQAGRRPQLYGSWWPRTKRTGRAKRVKACALAASYPKSVVLHAVNLLSQPRGEYNSRFPFSLIQNNASDSSDDGQKG